MGRPRSRSPLGIAAAAALACSLLAGAAAAQSLAEVAEKERDRRAHIDKRGESARVIGNEDLEASGDLYRSATRQERDDDAGPRSVVPAQTATERPQEQSSLTDKQARELRETWTRVWQARMAQARSELEVARSDAYQCQAASHYFFVPLAIDCDGVAARLAEAEGRLREVKRQRYHWRLLLPGGGPTATP